MKFALILVALLGCTNATLNEDFHDFWALIPTAEIREVTASYIANDPDFEVIITWLKGDFITVAQAIAEHDTWKEIVAWLESKDCDIYKLIDPVKALLGYSLTVEAASSEVPSYTAARSFHGWVDEVLALIPVDDLLALYNEKKETSADFQEFIAFITGDNIHWFVHNIGDLPEVQALLEKGREHGIDVDALLERIAAFLGWTH